MPLIKVLTTLPNPLVSLWPFSKGICLSKLTTDSTGTVGAGVAICKEAAGVGDDLSDVKPDSVIHTSSVVGADEEWSSQAAVRDTAVVGTLGIGESKARWTSFALNGLVNVGSGDSRREVFAGNARQCDILDTVSMNW